MAEYIDKQAFNSAIREAAHRYPSTFYNGLETARQIAHDMDAADVAPVVRCKDCIHSKDDGFICTHPYGLQYAFPNSFCSCGARMDGGEGI